MSLSRGEILNAFDGLRVWSRGAERAPHKPLLVLWALGRLERGEPDSIAFREVERPLATLLREFGPSRVNYHPEFPFWHLGNDGVWVVDQRSEFPLRKGAASPSKKTLLENDAHAHLRADIADALRHDPTLVSEIARRVLQSHFPDTLHQEILDAVGLNLRTTEFVERNRRDPEFRVRVLEAYNRACAVCGFDVCVAGQVLGVEAAHIQWHQAGGPDTEVNGLALCAVHHKSFDLGAFTVLPDTVLLVSQQASGGRGFDDWLMRFHGRTIRRPNVEAFLPEPAYLDWHRRQVFKEPPRVGV